MFARKFIYVLLCFVIIAATFSGAAYACNGYMKNDNSNRNHYGHYYDWHDWHDWPCGNGYHYGNDNDGQQVTYYVTGVVTESNWPVSNDQVTASQKNKVVASTYTDASGAYSLSLPRGEYNISETDFGYTTTVQLNANVTVNFSYSR